MDDKFLTLLRDLAEQLPSVLAILGCMIFALVRWKRHPKVSLVVIVALLILLVQFVLFTIVYTWVPDWFIDSADVVSRAAVTRNVYLVLGIISNTVLSIGLGILLVGIFMRRDPPGLTRDLAPETSPTIG